MDSFEHATFRHNANHVIGTTPVLYPKKALRARPYLEGQCKAPGCQVVHERDTFVMSTNNLLCDGWPGMFEQRSKSLNLLHTELL